VARPVSRNTAASEAPAAAKVGAEPGASDDLQCYVHVRMVCMRVVYESKCALHGAKRGMG
jgi:hypothetical protein